MTVHDDARMVMSARVLGC